MKTCTLITTVLVTSLITLSGMAQAADEIPELKERLAQVTPAHPRLYFNQDTVDVLKARIYQDPLLESTLDYIIACADEMIALETLERDQVGKRLLGVSRTCLRRVSYLAFSYTMTGEEKYLKRAEQEMLAVCGFSDWNPSHFLDVAEMTAGVALGYDWLYNGLSEESRKAIRAGIVEKGLKASEPSMWWQKGNNNWNQVCHAGMVMGALAVLEDEPELAGIMVTRAIQGVPHAMEEYKPHGVYPEGPSYWAYGTTFNVLLNAVLESVLGSDFGLNTIKPGFMKTPDFFLHATGPTGLYYNYSDCGTRGNISPAMHWFAGKCDDSGLLWREKPMLAEFIKEKPTGHGGSNRVLPFLFIWGQPMGVLETPTVNHWKGDGRVPVAIFRTAWEKDATYIGIKGGSPAANHGHMDIGSFVLDMKGVRWGIDLGAQGYNSLESKGIDLWNRSQNSERWTVFRLNNYTHSTLVVDGQLQQVKGNGPITKFSDDPNNPLVTIDLSSVYDGQLDAAHRGLRLVDEAVLIQDEVKTLEKDKTIIRWGMTTNAKVTLKENEATLEQAGETVYLEVASPKGATLQVYDLENPPNDYDSKNPNTRMIGFEVELPANTEETLTVLISPNETTLDEVHPIMNW